ncbi:MAG TPA: glycosyltransferase family 2 protein [Candidatus Micrarchaeia archaeon]|nr:glycosyltransferase family 2 protein [Candidatus Micrarchaeia archaeon]
MGAKSPCVDVIIPVYCEEPEALRATLEALLAQDHPPSKIYLIDDCSPVPARVPENLLAGGKVCLFRLEKNGGPSAARNFGIAKSTAPFVACVDSEILPAKNWIAACCRHFAAHPEAGVAYTRLVPHHPERLLTRWRMRFQEPKFPAKSGQVPFAPGHALMFRREAIERVAGFDARRRCAEDSDVCFRIASAGWETHFVADSECISIQVDVVSLLASKELTRSAWESPEDYPLSRFILQRTKWNLVRMGMNLAKLRLTLVPVDIAVWAASIHMAISRTLRSRGQKGKA